MRGWGHWWPSPLFPQQLWQLSDLQELVLVSVAFHPCVLSGMQHLQRLDLRGCILLQHAQDAAAAEAAADAAAAMSTLLTGAGGMTGLVSLVLHGRWSTDGTQA